MTKENSQKSVVSRRNRNPKKSKTILRAELMLAILDSSLDADTVTILSSMYEGVSIKEKKTGKYIGNIVIDDSNSTVFNYFKDHSFATV